MTWGRVIFGFRPHNPKVAGSNPAPATNSRSGKSPIDVQESPPLEAGFLRSRAERIHVGYSGSSC